MHATFLYVFVAAQCLSIAIGSPIDSLFDPLFSFDGTETSIDNLDILTADAGGQEDWIFGDPGGVALVPDSSVPSPPGTLFPGDSFDVGLGGAVGGFGGGTDLLAATDECYPKQRACCVRANYQQCYYLPSSQCSTEICCDYVDAVSLAGRGCQALNQPTQPSKPPATLPQNPNDGFPPDGNIEDWLNLLYGF